jgi:hypothetical protein
LRTSFKAELWAVVTGLELAWSMGETDSALVVALISKDYVKADANSALITKAREYISREWDVWIQHAYREANNGADWLINFGLIYIFPFSFLEQYPKPFILIIFHQCLLFKQFSTHGLAQKPFLPSTILALNLMAIPQCPTIPRKGLKITLAQNKLGFIHVWASLYLRLTARASQR